MPDELKEKIAYEYRTWNPSASIGRVLEFADSILSLIDAERCVWTEKTRSNGIIGLDFVLERSVNEDATNGNY